MGNFTLPPMIGAMIDQPVIVKFRLSGLNTRSALLVVSNKERAFFGFGFRRAKRTVYGRDHRVPERRADS
jgi:hypothetical protein